jgi:hypothetical protein
MKKKLAGILLALTLGFGGVVAMPTAPPAKADITGLIGSLTQMLLGLNFAGGLQQAIEGIIGAIQQSENALETQITLLASAQAQACAHDAVLNYADINSLNPVTLQDWAISATSCVTTIESLWSAIPGTSYVQLNELGMALSAVGPIAVTARAKAGLSTAALITSLQQAFTNVKWEFAPQCYTQPDPTTAELMDNGDQDAFFNVATSWFCASPLAWDSNELNGGESHEVTTYNTWQYYVCYDCNYDDTPLINEAGEYNSYGLAITALSKL